MFRLTVARKICYGSADIAWSTLGTALDAWFLFFLLTVAKVPAAAAAGAIFLGRTWDWMNDPLMGLITDRTRSRWGKRRPYLLFGAVPLGVAFVLLWWTPPIAGRFAVPYYGLAYVLYDTAITVTSVPFLALGVDLATTYDERTSLSSWRMVFSIAFGLAAMAMPEVARLPVFGSELRGWLIVAGLFGAVSAAAILLAFAVTGGVPEKPPEARWSDLVPRLRTWLTRYARLVAGIVMFLLAWIASFGVLPRVLPRFPLPSTIADFALYAGFFVPMTLVVLTSFGHNRPLMFGTVIFLLTWTTIAVITSVLPFYLTYWLRWPEGLTPVMAVIFGSALVQVPFWNWLTLRVGKRFAYAAGMTSLVLILAFISTLRPDAPRPFIFALAALAGMGVSAAHVVPNAILPDGLEWEELTRGKRPEGFYYGAVALLNKVANSVAVPWVALVLGFTGFSADREGSQPAETLLALRLLVGLVPGLLMAGGIAFAMLYPLDRARHERIRRLLELRAARAERAVGASAGTEAP